MIKLKIEIIQQYTHYTFILSFLVWSQHRWSEIKESERKM